MGSDGSPKTRHSISPPYLAYISPISPLYLPYLRGLTDDETLYDRACGPRLARFRARVRAWARARARATATATATARARARARAALSPLKCSSEHE